MNLIRKYNVSSLEYDMQKAVAKYFTEHPFMHQSGYVMDEVDCKVYREVSIPSIRRISDVIVQVTPRKIFNIECKNNDVAGVIKQAVDHLRWVDYSYICLHARTYLPNYEIRNMLKHGIGLLLWQGENKHWEDPSLDRPEALVDVIGAQHNTKKAGHLDPDLRSKVMKKLKKLDSKKTAETHKQLTI